MPKFQERVNYQQKWQQVAFLSVESSFLPRWYRPRLLLIGDAAHVMSPIGGVGINYAIQDAVATANILSTLLQKKQVRVNHLARRTETSGASHSIHSNVSIIHPAACDQRVH